MFFFFIPVGVDFRTRRYPVLTFTIMGLCTLMYLWFFTIAVSGGEAAVESYLSNWWFIPAESKLHTYLTSMFVHGGFWHLIGNMVYLFLFGSCVEDLLGRIHYVWFYVLGGLAAIFLHVLLSPLGFDSEVPLGGASGAISACQGAFLVALPRAAVQLRWVFFFFFRVWSDDFFLPAWLVISVWFGMDVLGMIGSFGQEGGGVAFAAHIGGFAFGAATMSLMKSLGKVKSAEEEEEEALLMRRRRMRSKKKSAIQAAATPNVYLWLNGNQSGPFTRAQVFQMIELGSVEPEALYWIEGMEDWRPLEEL